MKLSLIIRRTLAYLIDCILIFSFFFITQITIFTYIRQQIGIDENWFKNGYYTELYVLMTVSLPAWLYFSMLDSKLSRGTPGKRLSKIYLLNKHGLQISFPRNILRTILKLLPWEIAHLANNIPIPIMYDENPGMRFGFIICGLLMSIYIISLLATGGKKVVYDSVMKTHVTPGR